MKKNHYSSFIIAVPGVFCNNRRLKCMNSFSHVLSVKEGNFSMYINKPFRLKEFANINKSVVEMIIGNIQTVKPVVQNVECPYINEEATIRKALCEKFCNHTKEIETFQFENHRLTRSAIIQYIFYYFSNGLRNGTIRDISHHTIEEHIGFSIKTIRHNEELLEKVGLIYVAKVSRLTSSRTIHLISHPQHENKGYAKFSQKHFKELLSITNVNALRTHLLCYVTYDNYEIRRVYHPQEKEAFLSIAQIKSKLPKYARTTPTIESYMSSDKTLLSFKRKGEGFNFSIDEKFYGKRQETLRKDKLEELYTEVVVNYDLPIYLKKDYDDLIQLSMEYGEQTVVNILKDWHIHIKNAELLDEDVPTIKNAGGYIRQKIKSYVEQLIHYEEYCTG